jgi:hypothetical protein
MGDIYMLTLAVILVAGVLCVYISVITIIIICAFCITATFYALWCAPRVICAAALAVAVAVLVSGFGLVCAESAFAC